MKAPKVSVVILNWNGRKLLQQFLPSVLAGTYSNLEVVVADNASTDDSIDMLKNNFPTVKIIQNTTNEGFAKGYNTALAQVTADIYVLLNSDVEVTPTWIEPIVTLMTEDEKVGAAQPRILNQLHKTTYDYAGAAGGYIDYLGYPFAKGRVMDTLESDNEAYNTTEQVFWASGAALFIRSSIFKQLGGFDESFFAHQEEIDLCWRVQLAGYKVMACNTAVVYHVGGATLSAGSPMKTMLNFRNNLKMLSKNLPFWNGVFVIGIRLVLDGVAAWKFLFSGQALHFVAVAKAHFQFYRWRLFAFKKHTLPKQPLRKLHGVLSKSVVFQYFIAGKKTFSDISNN